MNDYTSISYIGIEASFLVSEFIAQRKQPHNIAESLVVPCCWEIVQSMLGKNAAKEIQKIPRFDNTVSWHINDMVADLLEQFQDKLLESKLFSIQLDESTDIKGKCLLLANIRFIGSDSLRKSFLFCQELPACSTGAEMCNTTAKFLEGMLQWKNCKCLHRRCSFDDGKEQRICFQN